MPSSPSAHCSLGSRVLTLLVLSPSRSSLLYLLSLLLNNDDTDHTTTTTTAPNLYETESQGVRLVRSGEIRTLFFFVSDLTKSRRDVRVLRAPRVGKRSRREARDTASLETETLSTLNEGPYRTYLCLLLLSCIV